MGGEFYGDDPVGYPLTGIFAIDITVRWRRASQRTSLRYTYILLFALKVPILRLLEYDRDTPEPMSR